MRGRITRSALLIVAIVAIVMTGFVAYGRGKTAGETAATNDRSSFARATSVAGGQAAGGFGTGGGGQRTGGAGNASGVAGGGTGGGNVSSVSGTVTKVDSGALTLLQQPNNITVAVATDASTTVTTFAPGALADLKMGDIVALAGDKTGDSAFAAKTIFALGGFPGGGGGQAAGGTAGTAPAGSAASGNRGRAAGNASAPAGRAGGGGLAGFDGPTGRITQIAGGTLTLQGFDGTTTTVTTNASTTVRTQKPGTLGDIKTGDTVAVQGDKTGDTAYTARAIIDEGAAAS